MHGRFSKSILWVYIIAFLGGISSYVLRILLSRNLSVADYGLVYALISFMFILAPLRDLGIYESALFFMTKYAAKKDYSRMKGIYSIARITQWTLTAAIAIVVFLIKPYLVNSVFKAPHADYLINVLLLAFLIGTTIPLMSSIFGVFRNLPLFSMKNHLINTLVLASTAIFLGMGYGIDAAVYGYLAATTIVTGLYFLLIHMLIKEFHAPAVRDKEMMSHLYGYAAPIMAASLSSVFLLYLDSILLAWLRNTESVGYYNVVQPSLQLIVLLITPLATVLFPLLSRHFHNGDEKAVSRIVSFLYNHILIVTLPIATFFFLYAREIIIILFGKKFVPATLALQIIVFFFIFLAMRDINFSVIAAIGKAKERSLIVIIASITSVALNVLFISLLDYTGAALATGIGYLIMAGLGNHVVRKHVKVRINWMMQLKILIATLFFAYVTYIMRVYMFLGSSTPLIIVKGALMILIGTAAYASCLFALKVVTKETVQTVRNVVFGKTEL